LKKVKTWWQKKFSCLCLLKISSSDTSTSAILGLLSYKNSWNIEWADTVRIMASEGWHCQNKLCYTGGADTVIRPCCTAWQGHVSREHFLQCIGKLCYEVTLCINKYCVQHGWQCKK
jgi:hypothetical protein